MNRIFIDVTIVIETPFVTGIQRVTRNLAQELIALQPGRVCPLYYSARESVFYPVPERSFVEWAAKKISADYLKKKIWQQKALNLQDFSADDIFLDLDSVWTPINCPRCYLYKCLKARGVRIVSYIYDIIPITFPQFVGEENLIYFLVYLGAIFNYADYVITSTQAVLDEVCSLAEKMGVRMPRGGVSWLGSNFAARKSSASLLDAEAISALTGKKYILCVGTLEPRKNQRLLLDAFEQRLYAEGFCLVVVGKIGWSLENLKQRLWGSSEQGKQLFCFPLADDAMLAWLYEHAFLVSVPTFMEGFCLPVVEALQYGVPVLLPDIPVLREVGRDYGEYFCPNDEQEFIEKVLTMDQDASRYQALRSHVKDFRPFTWHDTAAGIVELLEREFSQTVQAPENQQAASLPSAEQEKYESYVRAYVCKHGIYPELCCLRDDVKGKLVLEGPKHFRLPLSGHVCLQAWLGLPEAECGKLRLQYAFVKRKRKRHAPQRLRDCIVQFRRGRNSLPLELEREDKARYVYFRIQSEGQACELYVPLKGNKRGKSGK